jgi:hypothetical protein
MVQMLISIDGAALATLQIWLVCDHNNYSQQQPTHQVQTLRLSEVQYIEDKIKTLEIDKYAVCHFDETNVGSVGNRSQQKTNGEQRRLRLRGLKAAKSAQRRLVFLVAAINSHPLSSSKGQIGQGHQSIDSSSRLMKWKKQQQKANRRGIP